MDFLELQERMRAMAQDRFEHDFPLTPVDEVTLALTDGEFRSLYEEWKSYSSGE